MAANVIAVERNIDRAAPRVDAAGRELAGKSRGEFDATIGNPEEQ